MLRVSKAMTPKRLMMYIVLSDLLSLLVNGTVLLMSTISGQWLMGNTMCQVYGMMGLVLASGTTWVLAIAAMERYWKLLVPMDHPCMFSEINTKILICGAYLMMALIGANPLFGIGEYSFLRGKFELGVNITSVVMEEETLDVTSHFAEDTSVRHASCMNHSLSVDLLARSYLEAQLGLIIRSVTRTKGTLLFSLQAPRRHNLDLFWRHHRNGSIAQTFSVLHRKITGVTGGKNVREITTWIPAEGYLTYSRVFQPFQGLRLCMVDFTNTNPHTRMFTALLLAFAVIIPFGIMAFCYGSIYFNQYMINRYMESCQMMDSDCKALKALSNGSGVCWFLLCPYYVVNLTNGAGVYVPLWINFLCTLLQFCSGLPVIIFYVTLDRTFIKELLKREIKCHEITTEQYSFGEEEIRLKSPMPKRRNLAYKESQV